MFTLYWLLAQSSHLQSKTKTQERKTITFLLSNCSNRNKFLVIFRAGYVVPFLNFFILHNFYHLLLLVQCLRFSCFFFTNSYNFKKPFWHQFCRKLLKLYKKLSPGFFTCTVTKVKYLDTKVKLLHSEVK